MYENSKNTDCKKNSRRTPSNSNPHMEVLLWKETTDADLEEKQEVVYKDLSGAYSKLGTITDIFESEGFTYYLLSTAMGAYLADELKLIKR